ncbi:MAG TPA: methyltransferase domain-containing protein [Candidatus Limnocylindrales bacterium]|nr:methyltransferase domain-containing protein [Candidatus Limnocylindrales bacterium]
MNDVLYDRPEMFEAYARYRSEAGCKNDTIEQPAVRRLLPPLAGKRILDLGCGTGGFARYALDCGADLVVGVDASSRMSARARTRLGTTAHAEILEQRIEDFRWGGRPFDVIVSSLALHYVEPVDEVFRRCSEWIRPDGTLVLTVSHPLITSLLGTNVSPFEKRDLWNTEGPRPHTWLVDNVVKYHRRPQTYLQYLTKSGFSVASAQSLGRLGIASCSPAGGESPLPDYALLCARAH